MGDVSVDGLLSEIKKLGADPFEVLHRKKSKSAGDIEALRAEANAKSVQLAQAEERETHLKGLWDAAVDKRDAARASFPQGITKALADEEGTLTAISEELKSRKAELASLDETIARRKAQIDQALAAAHIGSMRSKSAVESAQTELTKAVAACAELAGQITEMRKRREAEDLPAAEVRLRDAKGQRDALPVPERIINIEELTRVKNDVNSLKAELERLERDLHKSQGALELVGGAVARERLRDATEAFERALQQERENEIDYEAWKLLLEQMKLADADQASNLGLTLAPAIAERFQALTNQRYETIQLDASLATEGVLVEGTLRDSDRMSVGTREQLSTLYRLCLAEYLQTVVVLDDQLVQSDENRMEWFRSLLTEKGKLFQIVVFTCRPRDYLEKGAIVPKGKSQFLDSSDGSIRAIDLGKLMSRSRSTSA
jgi:hypothetical protein